MDFTDLPHKPKDPEELFHKAKSLTESFYAEIEEKNISLDHKCTILKQTYGAEIELKWQKRSYCNCEDAPDCYHGQFTIVSQIFKVNSDFTLIALERWLHAQYTFAESFEFWS